MNYQIGQIKATLENSFVASAAGVISGSWASHVGIRMGETDMVGQVNMGRLPAIYVYQVSTNYEFQAEPDHFGTRTTEYVVRILVPNFMNRSETQYLKLETIKQAAMKQLTTNVNLGVTNLREDPPVVSQMSINMDFRFTSETSYDSTYDET